ncbi:MAG: hypothetical protein ACD_2C00148G0002 [uncultured bacterium (gcode 4)]|uniref:GIY-YIG domain-containing protein n=1 Tax=uncultured bacterium (gcode 4) TaxID=1234023 RepID=K2GGL4_9BACT|nr:MAG: hypothetical protein ACD_2C00148G0002 [uncultured bacterium (gcode 4)]
MSTIKSFTFGKEDFKQFESLEHWHNWPVVYIIENEDEMYIWETTNIYSRSNQHLTNEKRRNLNNIHIISDDEFNKSATLDIESQLIQNIFADWIFKIQNWNKWIHDHDYFNRDLYRAKFEVLWKKLISMWLAKSELIQIKNSDIFKFSPYKYLTEDQFYVTSDIIDKLSWESKTFLVSWKPWTWKTILAIYLLKALADDERTKTLKIGLVIPMTSLRKTIRKVIWKIKGLKSSMVMWPTEVINENYDLLIVDESHRLKKRKNLTNYSSHDNINKRLWLDSQGTELDWILKSSKFQVLLYDENQSIRPSDIDPKIFKSLNCYDHILSTQMRVLWWEDYIDFIDNIFENRKPDVTKFKDYEFKIFDDIWEMVDQIKLRDKEYWLSRMAAGFAWPWISYEDKSKFDIKIWETKLQWNSITQDWVNSPNALNEVGCIHTLQWYDLNYIWVIIWPELSYDPSLKEFKINKKNYYDSNWKRWIEYPEELKRYIINIYKTLLVRWIKWCYIYCVDKSVEEYFKSHLWL